MVGDMSVRPRVLALLLGVAGVLVPAVLAGHLPEPAVARLGAAPAPAPDAVAVLLAWDRRRATAYARGDPDALTALYAPGSRAGARDVELLASYVARGLRVRGMRTQVLAVRHVSSRERRLVVEVTDRVRGAVAVGRAARVMLPVSRPASRRVTFVRLRGDWLVREVVPVR